MIFKTEFGWVMGIENYWVAGRVRVPVGTDDDDDILDLRLLKFSSLEAHLLSTNLMIQKKKS